jgi:DNA-binding response OmpR family regulator
MPHSPRLLVIDFDADSGSLLVRALVQKFPGTAVEWCGDYMSAERALQMPPIDAIVLHRTHEVDAVTLIRRLRKIAPTVPIIAVSGVDRSEKVRAAGATGFLNYDEWLKIGTVVANALDPHGSRT